MLRFLLTKQAPKLVVVFMVGGTTYEEARVVAELNAAGMLAYRFTTPQRLLKHMLVVADTWCS